MKIINILFLVLLSCVFGSQCYAQGWCFNRYANNHVYYPYPYIPPVNYNVNINYPTYYVPVLVQQRTYVPVVHQRVEYRPMPGPYFLNYSHYYSVPQYYQQNNYYNYNHYNY